MSNDVEFAVEVSSDCVCWAEDERPDDYYCGGECFDEALESMEHLVDLWVDMNEDTATNTVTAIPSRGNIFMQEGFTLDFSDRSGENLARAFFLQRADFRIVFELQENGRLNVMRYSHDEPTGRHFAVLFTPDPQECPECGYESDDFRGDICKDCDKQA